MGGDSMKCPKCGAKTTVTLTYDGDDAHPRHRWLLDRALRVFGWWTSQDFRARTRRCLDCGHRSTTIEIDVDDLRSALEETQATTMATAQLQAGHGPH